METCTPLKYYATGMNTILPEEIGMRVISPSNTSRFGGHASN